MNIEEKVLFIVGFTSSIRLPFLLLPSTSKFVRLFMHQIWKCLKNSCWKNILRHFYNNIVTSSSWLCQDTAKCCTYIKDNGKHLWRSFFARNLFRNVWKGPQNPTVHYSKTKMIIALKIILDRKNKIYQIDINGS